jgi:hypothetical protein
VAARDGYKEKSNAMIRCLCRILGAVLLLHCLPVEAEELRSRQEVLFEPAGDTVPRLFLPPALRLVPEGESFTPRLRKERQEKQPDAIAVAPLVRHSASPSHQILHAVRPLLAPWVLRLSPLEPAAGRLPVESKSPLPLWSVQAPSAASVPRVDGALNLISADASAGVPGIPLNGQLAAGLEAQGGGTKQDRATNTVKGTVNANVLFRPGESVHSSIEDGRATGASQDSGLRVLLATSSAYEVNPRTGDTKARGAMVGTLQWGKPEPGRFQPTLGHKISFRWQPEVSCTGRGLVEHGGTSAKPSGVQSAHLMSKVRGDLRLDFLSPRLVVGGEYHYWQDVSSAALAGVQSTLSWRYELSSQAAVEGSLTRGTPGPSASPSQHLTIALGMRF